VVVIPEIQILNASAVQPDGKIVVVGRSPSSASEMARFHPDGTIDTSFGAGGFVDSPVGADRSPTWPCNRMG
jgi:hypothetical protein